MGLRPQDWQFDCLMTSSTTKKEALITTPTHHHPQFVTTTKKEKRLIHRKNQKTVDTRFWSAIIKSIIAIRSWTGLHTRIEVVVNYPLPNSSCGTFNTQDCLSNKKLFQTIFQIYEFSSTLSPSLKRWNQSSRCLTWKKIPFLGLRVSMW